MAGPGGKPLAAGLFPTGWTGIASSSQAGETSATWNRGYLALLMDARGNAWWEGGCCEGTETIQCVASFGFASEGC
jgi:hypothetical protein